MVAVLESLTNHKDCRWWIPLCQYVIAIHTTTQCSVMRYFLTFVSVVCVIIHAYTTSWDSITTWRLWERGEPYAHAHTVSRRKFKVHEFARECVLYFSPVSAPWTTSKTMGILEKIAEIEREIQRTQKNKGTRTCPSSVLINAHQLSLQPLSTTWASSRRNWPSTEHSYWTQWSLVVRRRLEINSHTTLMNNIHQLYAILMLYIMLWVTIRITSSLTSCSVLNWWCLFRVKGSM